MIGVAASLNLLLCGKITGVSGLVRSLVHDHNSWASVVIAGMLLAALVSNSIVSEPVSLSHSLLAGILVGVGTQMGNGCTSGHGVCGLPRFSARSLVAVCTFMTTGILTTMISLPEFPQLDAWLGRVPGISQNYLKGLIIFFILFALSNEYVLKRCHEDAINLIIGFGTGFLFACGLVISGMNNPTKVLGFLRLPRGLTSWDPALVFVLGGAITVNLISFPLILKRSNPIFNAKFGLPTRKDIDFRLVAGAAIFGIGWGIGGVCPGPGLVGLAQQHNYFSVWIIGFLSGLQLYYSFLAPEIKLKKH